MLLTVSEPDDAGDRKKKTLKAKIKGSKSTAHNDNKPNISYPTNFEHTVHVGFDAVTGEFTVSSIKVLLLLFFFIVCFDIASMKITYFHSFWVSGENP